MRELKSGNIYKKKGITPSMKNTQTQ